MGEQYYINNINNQIDLNISITKQPQTSEELLGAIGHVITLGPQARVLVHRHTVPCMYNEKKNGIKGMTEAIWYESGVSCEVIKGGTINVGDSVQIHKDEIRNVDDGNQPPGYYVPPSKRTTEMVMGTMKLLREVKEEYTEIDPEGVERVEASYGTVGLTFWPKDKKWNW